MLFLFLLFNDLSKMLYSEQLLLQPLTFIREHLLQPHSYSSSLHQASLQISFSLLDILLIFVFLVQPFGVLLIMQTFLQQTFE